MGILETLNTLLTPILPVETGIFSDTAPNRYIVITPMYENFEVYADDIPECEVQSARLSLYDKGNYILIKNTIVRALINAGITITDRRFIEHEEDTGYNHFAIDVAKEYEFEMEE